MQLGGGTHGAWGSNWKGISIGIIGIGKLGHGIYCIWGNSLRGIIIGILGTGTIKKQPVILEKNQTDIIAIRSIMMLSLGFDHRLIDGAGGAKFISRIKQNLENLKQTKFKDINFH